MNMHWEGYSDFGLFIPEKMLGGFLSAWNKDHPDEEPIEDMYDLDQCSELEGPNGHFNYTVLTSDCAGTTILSLAGDGWRFAYEGVLIYASKSNSAYSLLRHGFYSSQEEIIEEFKKKVGAYLPKDFDYLHHIGDVTWALYA